MTGPEFLLAFAIVATVVALVVSLFVWRRIWRGDREDAESFARLRQMIERRSVEPSA